VARSLSRLPLRCSRACNGFRREQAFIATKPHVDFDIENDSDELMVGIAITNAGPGPVAIKPSGSTSIASQSPKPTNEAILRQAAGGREALHMYGYRTGGSL
jgi:hypothetical protein